MTHIYMPPKVLWPGSLLLRRASIPLPSVVTPRFPSPLVGWSSHPAVTASGPRRMWWPSPTLPAIPSQCSLDALENQEKI